MATDITIPSDLWEDDSEAVLTNWFAGDGARVKAGALIAEIMVTKVQFEIEAPADGLLHISKRIDDIVRKGDVIGSVSEPGRAWSKPA